MALICTPPATWPGIVHKLGGLGTRAAIIVGEVHSDEDRLALRHALSAARPNLLRIVGPGSLGVVSPALRAHLGAPSCLVKAGGVAWVSQSNALTNAVLGWAHARGLGFSHAVALGGEADVDAGDVLDYLASDPGTRAILLELDTVRAARKFMSAARAAARNKPVLALRSGRADPADGLYTAAFRRAGHGARRLARRPARRNRNLGRRPGRGRGDGDADHQRPRRGHASVRRIRSGGRHARAVAR